MADLSQAPRASFTNSSNSTKEDHMIISGQRAALERSVPDRIIEQFEHLQNDYGGFPVDRLEHSIQSATRAERDGQDDEYVLCALIHDIGDPLAPGNHPDLAAAILKPFVSEANYWMVKHHGILQGYYYWHHQGMDRNTRDQYKSHEHYDRCATFCSEYDAPAFDPSYNSNPFDHYVPLIREAFSVRSSL
jgi:predicted HD phosphohydrolase